MKVGTDGILLGSWANGSEADKILDIGTGTGLIALMLAQKYPAQIDALEIDNEASLQASENIAASPWNGRIKVVNMSFQEFITVKDRKYDMIVSNPPFFQNSFKAPAKGRMLARHNDLLSTAEILSGARNILIAGGTLSIILPYIEGNVFIATASGYGFYCIRKTNVIPSPGKTVNRLLLEFSEVKSRLAEDNLIISTGARHHYSDKYKLMTRDYYLYFRDENEIPSAMNTES